MKLFKRKKDTSLMLVKPFGMPHQDQILEQIINRGFGIQHDETRVLREWEVCLMYNNVFQDVLKYQGIRGRDFIEQYLSYICMEPVRIWITHYPNLDENFTSVVRFRGSHYKSQKCERDSIRFQFPGEGNFNSFHATTSVVETEQHLLILGLDYTLDGGKDE